MSSPSTWCISGSDWFTWIEQVVLHLIVLSGIVQIQI
jgi:hypothetical protein